MSHDSQLFTDAMLLQVMFSHVTLTLYFQPQALYFTSHTGMDLECHEHHR
jgi:hypothetical protein